MKNSFLIILVFIILVGCSKPVDDEDKTQEIIPPVVVDKVDETDSELEEDSIRNVKLEVLESIQETYYYCVPASLQMVLKYNNIDKTQTELAEEMNTSPVTGTEYLDLARVANKYLFNNEFVKENEPGYHVQTLSLGNMSQDEKDLFESRVKTNISSKDPTFVAIDNVTMYADVSPANHLVVVVGYNEDVRTEKIISYIFIDPSELVHDDQYGGIKLVSAEKMFEAISNNEEPAYIY